MTRERNPPPLPFYVRERKVVERSGFHPEYLWSASLHTNTILFPIVVIVAKVALNHQDEERNLDREPFVGVG